jgi:hypothetical protein
MIFPNVPTTFAAFACLFDLKDFVHIIDDTPQATRKRASSRSRPPQRCATARDPRTPLNGRGRGSRLSRHWKKAEEAGSARAAPCGNSSSMAVRRASAANCRHAGAPPTPPLLRCVSGAAGRLAPQQITQLASIEELNRSASISRASCKGRRPRS